MSRCILYLPTARVAVQKPRKPSPKTAPASVILPISLEFGVSEGLTLSVAKAIDRKSPVIMTMTISSGVSTAWPVIRRPIVRNKS